MSKFDLIFNNEISIINIDFGFKHISDSQKDIGINVLFKYSDILIKTKNNTYLSQKIANDIKENIEELKKHYQKFEKINDYLFNIDFFLSYEFNKNLIQSLLLNISDFDHKKEIIQLDDNPIIEINHIIAVFDNNKNALFIFLIKGQLNTTTLKNLAKQAEEKKININQLLINANILY